MSGSRDRTPSNVGRDDPPVGLSPNAFPFDASDAKPAIGPPLPTSAGTSMPLDPHLLAIIQQQQRQQLQLQLKQQQQQQQRVQEGRRPQVQMTQEQQRRYAETYLQPQQRQGAQFLEHLHAVALHAARQQQEAQQVQQQRFPHAVALSPQHHQGGWPQSHSRQPPPEWSPRILQQQQQLPGFGNRDAVALDPAEMVINGWPPGVPYPSCGAGGGGGGIIFSGGVSPVLGGRGSAGAAGMPPAVGAAAAAAAAAAATARTPGFSAVGGKAGTGKRGRPPGPSSKKKTPAAAARPAREMFKRPMRELLSRSPAPSASARSREDPLAVRGERQGWAGSGGYDFAFTFRTAAAPDKPEFYRVQLTDAEKRFCDDSGL